MNNRLHDLSVLDLARFTTELKQAQINIVKLKKLPISGIFDLRFVKIDDKNDIVYLMG